MKIQLDPNAPEDFYDKQASQYDECRGSIYYYFERNTVLSLLPDLKGKKALDLACGSGLYTRDLADRSASLITGVDLSGEMVDIARQHPRHNPDTTQYIHSDVCTWTPDTHYDFVLISYLFSYAKSAEHLNEMINAICKCAVKPAKLMVILDIFGLRRAENYGEHMEELRIYHHTPRSSYESFRLTMKAAHENEEDINIFPSTIAPDELREALDSKGFENIIIYPPFFHPDAWQHIPGKTISRITTYPYCLIITADFPARE